MADTDITLRIRADLDQAQRELNRMRGALRQIGGSKTELSSLDRVFGRLRSAARRRSGDHAGA